MSGFALHRGVGVFFAQQRRPFMCVLLSLRVVLLPLLTGSHKEDHAAG